MSHLGRTDSENATSASPQLLQRILRSKRVLASGNRLPVTSTAEFLDSHTLDLILRLRPAKGGQEHIRPTRGARSAVVLLVDFQDRVARTAQDHYTRLLFSRGSHPTGSMSDFYSEVSCNRLVLSGAVHGEGGSLGWFRAPRLSTFYAGNNFGRGSYPENSQKLVEELVDLAASRVDFRPYDQDGDGEVDLLLVVHAGPGGEATGVPGDLWSVQWQIAPRDVGGVRIRKFALLPEDGSVGVFCHEVGHLLGLPDFYDYGYDSAGTGNWDLMAGGSWNNGGRTPAHPMGWCKAKLGWVEPEMVSGESRRITVTPCARTGCLFRLPSRDTGGKEYFLLENRKKLGFDRDLPGEGLLISHVDENMPNNNDQKHYLVDIEECDGRQDLEQNTNRGDATDPYPSVQAAFTRTTQPASRQYDGRDSNVSVTGIRREDDNIVCDASTAAGPGAENLVWYIYGASLQLGCAHSDAFHNNLFSLHRSMEYAMDKGAMVPEWRANPILHDFILRLDRGESCRSIFETGLCPLLDHPDRLGLQDCVCRLGDRNDVWLIYGMSVQLGASHANAFHDDREGLRLSLGMALDLSRKLAKCTAAPYIEDFLARLVRGEPCISIFRTGLCVLLDNRERMGLQNYWCT